VACNIARTLGSSDNPTETSRFRPHPHPPNVRKSSPSDRQRPPGDSPCLPGGVHSLRPSCFRFRFVVEKSRGRIHVPHIASRVASSIFVGHGIEWTWGKQCINRLFGSHGKDRGVIIQTLIEFNRVGIAFCDAPKRAGSQQRLSICLSSRGDNESIHSSPVSILMIDRHPQLTNGCASRETHVRPPPPRMLLVVEPDMALLLLMMFLLPSLLGIERQRFAETSMTKTRTTTIMDRRGTCRWPSLRRRWWIIVTSRDDANFLP
jgi:hypothetical protein